ncbi:hypothetical protein C2W64_02108 [Brevibacillus laterosporus]|nr:hypothetical protein C2W64_02108 [Brevibacillus laterosporus]
MRMNKQVEINQSLNVHINTLPETEYRDRVRCWDKRRY